MHHCHNAARHPIDSNYVTIHTVTAQQGNLTSRSDEVTHMHNTLCLSSEMRVNPYSKFSALSLVYTANTLGNTFTQRWVKYQQSKLFGKI